MTTVTGHDDPPPPAPPGHDDHKADHKADQLARLHRVEGQVRGIARMVDGDRYCVDVITQISAVTHALQEVALGLLEDHVRHCVSDAAHTDSSDARIDEITVALRRTLRL